jgi:two-component system, NarL family, invasion response regulator UvrY
MVRQPDIPRRILLAEDCPAVRQSVRALLEREGFDVVGEAADGEEAVRVAQALHPDVVLLDRVMPKLNGFEAAREIARRRRHPHLILLAIDVAAHHVVMGLRLGIRGFVSKSDAADELVHAVDEVTHGRIFLSASASRVVREAHLADAGIP